MKLKTIGLVAGFLVLLIIVALAAYGAGLSSAPQPTTTVTEYRTITLTPETQTVTKTITQEKLITETVTVTITQTLTREETTQQTVTEYRTVTLTPEAQTVTKTVTQTVTETVTPTPATTPTPGTWREVAVFKGVADKTTDLFEIKGNRFRLTWRIEGANDLTGLSIFCYPEGETKIFVGVPVHVSGSKQISDTTIIYSGPGKFYLVILAANLDGWQIIVEDFY